MLRASACGLPASFLLLLFVLREHFFEQGGADVFQVADGLVDRRLVFEGEGAFDVAQLVGNFSNIDLDILECFLVCSGGVAGFLGVGDDVIDGGARPSTLPSM